jgi:integrase/recombinase XerC
MNIKDAIYQFQDYMIVQRGFSPRTISAYVSDLEKFSQYLLTRQMSTLVEEVETQDIVSYLAYLTHPDDQKEPILVISRARKLASIRSFYTFLRKRRIISISPADEIDIPKLPKLEPDFLTINEYQKLLKVIAETASPFFKFRDLAIVSLFISTGIRVSELVNLMLNEVDFEYLTIKVRRKGNKQQTIPLNTEMIELLKRYLEVRPEVEEQNLFISKKGKGVRANTVYCLVKKYLELAGLDKSKKGPHLLRHSCLTTLLAKGVNPVVIQQLAGHSSFDTTRRYLHLNNAQIRDAVQTINLKGDI